MFDEKLYKGYNSNFLLSETGALLPVAMPQLNSDQLEDIVTTKELGEPLLHYINYSIQLSATHKFPFFTAVNIDGKLFKNAPRTNNWRKDPRINDDEQWGEELYRATKSNFDKGHLAKREDVQWGETIALARRAADTTFYYTNAVPQHAGLNQDIWLSLEDYILHTETVNHGLRVCVFSGPVLSYNNPFFVTRILGDTIQLPILFWKVVVYPKADGRLYRVGFMMSQNRLFIDSGIVKGLALKFAAENLFLQFDDAATYQVNISLIESLTGLTMPAAIDSYTDERSTKLVLEEIDIDPDAERLSSAEALGYVLQHLRL
ncbi:DNA/RNA non-specific endonuclease [Pedobacter sp.]|uniref:DNA/RNA non-specific endonuclease n=1 Tax=Pedobacter sp. TaxID=1411316 RepID=UPI003D7F2A45